MSKSITVDIVGVETSGGNYLLKGIPYELFARFVEEAAVITGNTKDGWAELIYSLIYSVIKTDKRVILVNEIPEKVYETLDAECIENKTSISELITTLLKASELDAFRLFTLFETAVEESSGALMINGIHPHSLKRLFRILQEGHLTPLNFFQTMERSIRESKLSIATLHAPQAESNTLIITGVPDSSIKFFNDEAKKFRLIYEETSGEESQMTGLQMLAQMLMDAGSKTKLDMSITKPEDKKDDKTES
jgi:hypothetical protein